VSDEDMTDIERARMARTERSFGSESTALRLLRCDCGCGAPVERTAPGPDIAMTNACYLRHRSMLERATGHQREIACEWWTRALAAKRRGFAAEGKRAGSFDREIAEVLNCAAAEAVAAGPFKSFIEDFQKLVAAAKAKIATGAL
jgi:hypothetical protein